MEEAAKSNRCKGILGINKAPTVSVDFNHDPHSSTFDVTQTQVLDKRFVRVLVVVRQRMGVLEPHGRGRRLFGSIWLRASKFLWLPADTANRSCRSMPSFAPSMT